MEEENRENDIFKTFIAAPYLFLSTDFQFWILFFVNPLGFSPLLILQ